jgi:CheY-like chemotaxis protein
MLQSPCPTAQPSKMGFKYRILVVDDEPLILKTSALVLADQGYDVRTAADGFQALVELRQALPDMIISDLSMPNMSGFEFLSVVRRRFPHIPVIAISGEYSGTKPSGLIADCYFSKGHYTPEELFAEISRLLEQDAIRPHIERPDKAPVWIPRHESGYVVITCTQCLRSFSVSEHNFAARQTEVQEIPCEFCDMPVQVLIDQRVKRVQELETISKPSLNTRRKA